MSLILIVILSLINIALLAIAIYFIYRAWKIHRRHTRQAFVRRAMQGFTVLVVLAIPTLVPNLSLFDIIGLLIWLGSGNSVDDFSPMAQNNTSLLLIFWFFIFTLYTFWTYRIWLSWDGSISKLDYRRELRHEDRAFRSFRQDVRLTVSLGKNPELYKPIERQDALIESMPVPRDTITWEERAKELVDIKRQDYSFSVENNRVFLNDRESFWVGEHVNNDKLIFVYPVFQDIQPDMLKTIIIEIENICMQRNGVIGEIIIVSNTSQITPLSPNQYDITYTTEEQLLDNLVDWRNYRYEIQQRVSNPKLDEDYPIIDTYVSQDVRYWRQDKASLLPPFVKQNSVGQSNLKKQLLRWLESPGREQIALLGEYGMGKSTASLMFTYELLNDASIASGYMPILLELRGKSPATESPQQMLAGWAYSHGINPKALMILLRAGRLLIILEGFDEMDLVGDYDRRIAHFRTLWQFAYPGAKVLFTGRPNYFETIQELSVSLQINYEPGINRPSCIRFDLVGFRLEQVSQALQCYAPEIVEQISSHARANSSFFDIVKRPSMTSAVAQVWEQYGLNQQTENLTNAVIMRYYIENTYARQLNKRAQEWQFQVQRFGESNAKRFMFLHQPERHYFMRGIAAYMANKRLNNQIKSTELNTVIRELLSEMPDASNMDAHISNEGPPLRVRIGNSQYSDESVITDVRSCGLLVEDDVQENAFKFSHFSQLEYLFASVMADSFVIKHKRQEDFYLYAIWRASNLKITDLFVKREFLDYFADLVRDHFGAINDTEGVVRGLLLFLGCSNTRRLLQKNRIIVNRVLLFVSDLLDSHSRLKSAIRFFAVLIIIFPTLFLLINSGFFDKSNIYFTIIAVIASMFAFLSSFSDLIGAFSRISKYQQRGISSEQAWQYICQKAGVSAETMHKAFGTNIEIINISQFNYFPIEWLDARRMLESHLKDASRPISIKIKK